MLFNLIYGLLNLMPSTRRLGCRMSAVYVHRLPFGWLKVPAAFHSRHFYSATIAATAFRALEVGNAAT